MQKISMILNIALLAIIGILIYSLLNNNENKEEETKDYRIAVVVTKDERFQLQNDMNELLQNVRIMLTSLSNEDLEKFAATAKNSGMEEGIFSTAMSIDNAPLKFRGSMIFVYESFDELADMADNRVNQSELIDKLSSILGECVGCHRDYRLEIEQ